MNKKGLATATLIFFIAVFLFFAVLWIGGWTVGSGILGVLRRIPAIGWFIIFLFLFMWSAGRGKK